MSRRHLRRMGARAGQGLVAVLLAAAPARAAAAGRECWVGTWASSPQLADAAQAPPAPGFAGNTVRQVVQVSVGARRLRLRLSNAFGAGPLEVRSAHLA